MIERSYRKLIVHSVVPESDSAKSFYLAPHDGGVLDQHLPGQHLPLRLEIPGRDRPVFRCYTISNFEKRFYRLTIKREVPPADKPGTAPGLSSTYFHDAVHPGDILEAKPPSGNFWLDLQKDHPVVMLAGGIGVTPMMSMIEALASSASKRDVYFFYALRHSGDHVFKARLKELAEQCPNLRLWVLYEQASDAELERRDCHETGRIHLDLLRERLPSLNLEYYLCGPQGMMKALSEGLNGAGVSPDNIRTESFGPSGIALRSLISSDENAFHALQRPSGMKVTFMRSGVSIPWTGEAQSLLQLAEANGIDISSGCQYGDCGTCMTRVLEGSVKYLHPTGARPDGGCCLPCSCHPETSLVLDA